MQEREREKAPPNKFTKNQKSNLRRKKRLIEARANPENNWSLIFLCKKARKALRQINNIRKKLRIVVEEAQKPGLEKPVREKLHAEIDRLSAILKTKQYFYEQVKQHFGRWTIQGSNLFH